MIKSETWKEVSMATAVIWSSRSLKAHDRVAPTPYLDCCHFTMATIKLMTMLTTQLLQRESQQQPWARWWGGRWRGWCTPPRWGWRGRWARWRGRWSSPSPSPLLATSTLQNWLLAMFFIFEYLSRLFTDQTHMPIIWISQYLNLSRIFSDLTHMPRAVGRMRETREKMSWPNGITSRPFNIQVF